MDSESIVQLFRARRAILQKPLPVVPKDERAATAVTDPTPPAIDMFACEQRSFYSAASLKPHHSSAVRKPKRSGVRIQQDWTSELDEVLRKCLRKVGWAKWKTILATKRFPSNFTTKTLARRAKDLGYTKEGLLGNWLFRYIAGGLLFQFHVFTAVLIFLESALKDFRLSCTYFLPLCRIPRIN